ncbi:MAG: hypothetical protein QM765_46250 [Myxococcales bacterium]
MLPRLVVVVASTLLCSTLAQAEPVARVLVVKGEPQVVVKSQRVPAKPEQLLSRGDGLEVPANAWLVLQVLKNGYAVKIDEDLVMPVKDIALLDAPKTAATIDDQLEAMVKSREIDRDRVTGYQNRKVAGEGLGGGGGGGKVKADRAPAPPPPPAQKPTPAPAPPPPAPERTMAESAATVAGAPRAAPKGTMKKEMQAEPEADEARLSAKESVASKADADLARPDYPWALVADGKVELQSAPLDPEIVRVLAQAGIAQCIANAWTAAGLQPRAVDHLLLRRSDGKVQARLGSRLTLDPACVNALGAVFPKLPPNGWMRVEVRLGTR